MDLMGPIDSPWGKGRDGTETQEIKKIYRFILTIMDNYSKWIEIIPTKTMESKEICAAVDKYWFCAYPKPTNVMGWWLVNEKKMACVGE